MPPLSVGDQLTLPVTDLGHSGDGVARVNDFVVFVPFSVPEDVVQVEVVSVGKAFARARVLAVETPSPHRVDAPCPVFTQCGGCQLQHIDYSAQLAYKERWIAETLRRIGGLEVDGVEPVQPSNQQYRYRDRVRVTRRNSCGTSVIGFISADGKRVEAVSDCLLQSSLGDRILRRLHQLPHEPM